MAKDKIAVVFAVLAVIVGGGYWAYQKYGAPADGTGGKDVACAQDARSCPDGSYVNRRPPTCEFKACPGGGTPLPPEEFPDTSGWKTYRNEEYEFEVKYPDRYETKEPQHEGEKLFVIDLYDAQGESYDFSISIHNKSLEEELRELKSSARVRNFTTQSLRMGGLDMVVAEWEHPIAPFGTDTYVIKQEAIIQGETTIYVLFANNFYEDTEGEIFKTFRQILSTFKFIK